MNEMTIEELATILDIDINTLKEKLIEQYTKKYGDVNYDSNRSMIAVTKEAHKTLEQTRKTLEQLSGENISLSDTIMILANIGLKCINQHKNIYFTSLYLLNKYKYLRILNQKPRGKGSMRSRNIDDTLKFYKSLEIYDRVLNSLYKKDILALAQALKEGKKYLTPEQKDSITLIIKKELNIPAQNYNDVIVYMSNKT